MGETSIPSEPIQPQPPVATSPTKSNKKWLWWTLGLVILLAIGVGIWWMWRPNITNDITKTTNPNSTTTSTPVATIDKSKIVVQMVEATYEDNSQAVYQIMADGTWKKVGHWQRAVGDKGSIVMMGTLTPGIFTLWRTTAGETIVVDNVGKTLDPNLYPLYVSRAGSLYTIYKLDDNSFLAAGDATNPSNIWPTADATNNDLYIIDAADSVQKRISLSGIINNRLDGLRLHGVSSDKKYAYASIAGYEGNITDSIWKINLTDSTYQKLADSLKVAYSHIALDPIIEPENERALLVEGTEKDCTDCMSSTTISAPATVKLLDLETNAISNIHTSKSYLPSVLVPADGKIGYILEQKAEQKADGSILSYSGQGIWQVNLKTGAVSQLEVQGLVRGMSASGRFLLIVDNDTSPATQNIVPANYSIYDVQAKTSTSVVAFPDNNPKFSTIVSCPQAAQGACFAR